MLFALTIMPEWRIKSISKENTNIVKHARFIKIGVQESSLALLHPDSSNDVDIQNLHLF